MTTQKVSIDIVSDVVCPWCIIGFKRLEKALKTIESNIDVNIAWQPFELNPGLPPGGENLRLHLANKYGTTLEGSIAARKRLTEIGDSVGFTFKYFDDMKMFNTRKAHKLIHWSKNKGKQTQLKLALFDAFFAKGLEIDQESVLLEVAESVGLLRVEATAALNDTNLEREVVEVQSHWREMGINSVPAFIFNGQYAVSGAQEVSYFEQVLRKIIAD